MPSANPDLRRAAARAGAAARWSSTDEAPARDLAAERIAAYVERVVSNAPPLTRDQRSRITSLLRGAVK